MKIHSRVIKWAAPLVLLLVACTASIAEAVPREAGDWDPREIPSTPLLRETQLAVGPFNWNLASFSERKAYLTKKGLNEGLATEAALGGAPLTPVRADGRGLFFGNLADGMISRGIGLILRFW